MASYSLNQILIAGATGILPTILWLIFWLRGSITRDKPKGLYVLCYILGAFMVFLVIPIQKLLYPIVGTSLTGIILFSSVEEIAKYAIVNMVAFKSQYANRPIDFVMFLIAGALGFAALENVFFILKPLSEGLLVNSFITGNVRFLGATLLHAMSSGLFGVAIGLAYYRNFEMKPVFVIFGFALAVLLHSAFNFFIIKGNGTNNLETLAFLWIVAIFNILLFEKLKRMNSNNK